MNHNYEEKDRNDAASTPLAGMSVSSPRDKRPWMMRHKLLTFAAVFLLAALTNYLVTRPEDNPQPKKKLLVQGSFPYEKGWDLRIKASYYSRNPTCRQTARAFFIFPQAEVTREAWRTVPVVREENNRYRFEFHEDALLPGFCDWQLQFVHYVVTKNGKEIQGGAILGFPGRYNVIRYGCSTVTMRNLSGVACYEGDDHWKHPTKTDYQIDFVWEEK